MASDPLLFTTRDLTDILDAEQWEAKRAIDDWDPEELLAAAEADVAEYLVSKHSVACPVLRRELTQMLPVSEDVEIFVGAFEQVRERVTKIAIAVPFDGTEDVFRYRAKTSTRNPPRAKVRNGELILSRAVSRRAPRDPAEIRQHFENELDKIQECLGWAWGDIVQHNLTLRTLVSISLAARKAQLLADRQLEAGLGFPVRQRSDATRYAIPITRRKIDVPPRPSAGGPFQPEPVLVQAQYEQALVVLRNARNALERSPSMTASLDEEKIRDLLLISLNAQFEGSAAGEVFNAAGKTDILIRVGDRNVFIAECKIWRGPKTTRDALSQLLTYLTWRDTKAALLVFIRSGQPTTIIEKAVTEIGQHPNLQADAQARRRR